MSATSSTANAVVPRLSIGNLQVDAHTFASALGAIEALVSAGKGGAVFTPNVDHVVKVEHDAELREAYAAADLCLADGMPLVWASRLLSTRLPERVAGSDLVVPLLELAARRGWGVYLLGGAPGSPERAAVEASRLTGVRIAGTDAPVIDLSRPHEGDGTAALVRVRAARPELLLVGLGAPKQELWIHRHRVELAPTVAIGVGASIDFLAGRIPRAPQWMAQSGLEWAYRLAREPRRLARRYLLEDPEFLIILARAIAARASARATGTSGPRT
ncbi:MAG TPA: WecB/TagA/CpsF family glycosyltransferase [Anaeromyxobacteraceae bacterium]|nr:WecB/TagA/CpsF family glycosyltransferase [Anaeromyxobacteraceae bacterium]